MTMNDPAPVAYMARTRAYYEAQGFERAYAWARHDDAPFAPPTRPVAALTLGVVTTAALSHRPELSPRKVDSCAVEARPPRLFTDDLSWDKQATHTDDPETFCPLETLRAFVRDGTLGALAPRFHCAPTEYSQRATIDHDAPELLRRLREDGADIALLIPL